MIIDIITLFPEMFKGPFDESIIKRARDKKSVEINIHNLRNWSKDKHKTVDDRPYGGGKGMIFRVDVVFDAISDLKSKKTPPKADPALREKIILLSPQGKVFNQKKARELLKQSHIILICGHYEGVDQRIPDNLIDEEISIGKYVLTGGELPAMIVTDTIIRLIPGVLDKKVTLQESFSKGKTLDFPQYTRPEIFKGWKVPKILLSGDHREIEKWRKENSLKLTK